MALVWKMEDGLLMVILVGMIVLSFAQILLRIVLGRGLVWIQPLIQQMLLWVALMGAVVATRNHNHITVDAVSRFLPEGRIKLAAGLICDTFALIICALLTYSTFLVFWTEYTEHMLGYVFGSFPYWATLLTLPVAFGVMTLRFVRFSILSLVNLIRGREGS